MSRFLSYNMVKTLVIVYATIAASFVLLIDAQVASAAATPPLVIGLQNDMTNLNPVDPATNTVWNAYQVSQLNFEGLITSDPDGVFYPALADPAATCPAGTTLGPTAGVCIDTS